MNPVLTIDPEFEAKCPPLTEDELSQLEENILEEGLVLMPLIVWNDTIVDGHNRYRIAQTHPGIGFRTHEKNFNSKYEAEEISDRAALRCREKNTWRRSEKQSARIKWSK